MSKTLLTIILILVCVCSQALGQDVTPIMEGEIAPCDGLLVKEERFKKMLEAELGAEDFQGRFQIQKNLTASLEAMYIEKLKEATRPMKWYETSSFNRWLGFSIGVILTAAAIWGGTEIVKTTR